MAVKNLKEIGRIKRHRRIKKKIRGTQERPRLCLHRSLTNLYAQCIDDVQSKTLISLSTRNIKIDKGGNVKAAKVLGEAFAKKAKETGIEKIVFDRGGYQYHGRVKAFAEAARKNGLTF